MSKRSNPSGIVIEVCNDCGGRPGQLRCPRCRAADGRNLEPLTRDGTPRIRCRRCYTEVPAECTCRRTLDCQPATTPYYVRVSVQKVHGAIVNSMTGLMADVICELHSKRPAAAYHRDTVTDHWWQRAGHQHSHNSSKVYAQLYKVGAILRTETTIIVRDMELVREIARSFDSRDTPRTVNITGTATKGVR